MSRSPRPLNSWGLWTFRDNAEKKPAKETPDTDKTSKVKGGPLNILE